MSLPDKLYAWTDTNATPNTYYTDNTTIAVDMPLYDNQGSDTGQKINYIETDDTFNVDFTLTVNTTPSDATVTFDTGTVHDKTCIVPNGSKVTYTISKEDYITSDPVTVIVNSNQTINAPALIHNIITLSYPDDAILSITNLNGNFKANPPLARVAVKNGTRSFSFHIDDMNRTLNEATDENGYYYIWIEKGTNLKITSAYTTSSSFGLRKLYRYTNVFVVENDITLDVTDADYQRVI